MRQHAIPQNILDIEFKLFTKFTVREFVYMAIGIGFGGIFLYFFTLGQVPGIIAFPVFLVSSGTGLFLGLVNINDQKSDIFIRNYIWAISHPTQRVWKNTMIDEKFEQIKPEFNITQGNTNRNNETETNSEIIGGSTDLAPNQFIQKNGLDEIDREEQERLRKITELAQTTMQTPIPTQVVQPTTQPTTQPINQPVAQPTSQIPQQPPQNTVQAQPVTPTQTIVPQTPAQTIVQPKPQNIRIDRNNLSQFITTMSRPLPLPGNLNFKVVNNADQPINSAIIIIKDTDLKVVSALQSDSNGEAYSNKQFPISTYVLSVQAPVNTFPSYQLVLDTMDINSIKITAN